MEDNSGKVVLCQSTTIPSSTVNNENESENQRNSELIKSKNANFMAPTISAASKFNSTPTMKKKKKNKKIFTEWKSPKSDVRKMGNSNSGSRKYLPKIPSFTSPTSLVNSVKSGYECDDVEFVLDSVNVPYDPQTNYLSPRPRFLRYRPNRKSEILAHSESESDSTSSLRDSVESQGCDSVVVSAGAEIGEGVIRGVETVVQEEIGENVISDKQAQVHEEIGGNGKIEDLDEEEGVNWGFKWVFFKCVIVFSALIFCAMFLCGMNSSYTVPRQEIRGMNVEYGESVNMSSRIVSLRGLGSDTWILNVKNGSKMGVFDDEINDFGVESGESLGRVDEIRESVEDQETEFSEKDWELRLENEDYLNEYVQIDLDPPVVDSEVDDGDGMEYVEYVVPDLISEYEQVETQAPMVASEQKQEAAKENVSDSEAEVQDSEAKTSDAELKRELEDVTADSDNVVDSGTQMADSEGKPKGEESAKEMEGVTAADSSKGNDYVETEAVNFDPKFQEEQSEPVAPEPDFNEEQSQTVRTDGGEEYIMGSSDQIVIENEQLRLTSRDLIWAVISPLVAFSLLACLLLKFYRKCRRSSSRTRSSGMKLGSTVGKTSKSRPQLLPKTVQQADQHRLSAPLVQKTDHPDLHPPSASNPQESLEIIPKVRQLGEFEVGAEFSHPVKSSSVKTEMQERDEIIYSTPDTRKTLRRPSVSGRTTNVQPSSSVLSTAESYSCGSYISQDTTSMKEDGKDEVNKLAPTPRRSARLRNKGVTSP